MDFYRESGLIRRDGESGSGRPRRFRRRGLRKPILKGLAALAPGPQPARQRMPRLQAGRGKFGRESPRGGALRLLVVEQNLDGVEISSKMASRRPADKFPVISKRDKCI
jgi:hypothetical protein